MVQKEEKCQCVVCRYARADITVGKAVEVLICESEDYEYRGIKLQEENTKLEKALEFYADPYNYEMQIIEPDPINGLMNEHAESPEIYEDQGKIARNALGKKDG